MTRKKWTAKTEINDSLILFREKRKWQIALRRYLVQRSGSGYAPYFGLDILNFRKWIEIQFDEDMSWENFSASWQLDHIVPVAYFDFSLEEDLRLCWNFTNIRIEKLQLNKNRSHRIDVIASKAYFQALYEKTHYKLCLKMIEKIEKIEASSISSNQSLEAFILERSGYLQILSTLAENEFKQLNKGISLDQIVSERNFIEKLR